MARTKAVRIQDQVTRERPQLRLIETPDHPPEHSNQSPRERLVGLGLIGVFSILLMILMLPPTFIAAGFVSSLAIGAVHLPIVQQVIRVAVPTIAVAITFAVALGLGIVLSRLASRLLFRVFSRH